MDPSDAIQIIILIILLALSAVFSSAETSMTTFNKMRMRSYADAGNQRNYKTAPGYAQHSRGAYRL